MTRRQRSNGGPKNFSGVGCSKVGGIGLGSKDEIVVEVVVVRAITIFLKIWGPSV